MPQNNDLRCGCFLITALSNTDIRLAGGDKVFFGYRFKFKRSSENLNSCFQTTFAMYSGLTLNQYGVASPCRTICTVCGFVALS